MVDGLSTVPFVRTSEGAAAKCVSKATRTNKSFIGVLWGAWSDGVVAHWVELIALEVEAAISSFTDLGPPQTRFTQSCVCPNGPDETRKQGVPAGHDPSGMVCLNLVIDLPPSCSLR